MIHKNSSKILKKIVSQGEETYIQVHISSEEAQNFAMRKFTIKAGGSIPLHTNLVEHEQYVLRGEAELNIGKNRINVKKDDVVYIPFGVEHDYKNTGQEPFEFLCIIPNKEDKITIVK